MEDDDNPGAYEEQANQSEEEGVYEAYGDTSGDEDDESGQSPDENNPDLEGVPEASAKRRYYTKFEYNGGEARVFIRFEGNGNIPAVPSPGERVYRDFQPASQPSSLDIVVNRGPPTQLGTKELRLLRSICGLSDNDPGHNFDGEPDDESHDDSDTACLAKALQHVPASRHYLPVAPSQGTEKMELDTESSDTKAKDKGIKKFSHHSRLDSSQAPLSDIYGIFDSITKHAVEQGLIEASQPFKSSGLRVITMCSGTEAPFVAMNLVQKSLASQGNQNDFRYTHVGSAEIEPWKQAFIERNFRPPQIFRDVTDFKAYSEDPTNKNLWPVTAYGAREKPAEDAHILIAGSSCVDYSSLNSKAAGLKGTRGQGESAQTLDGILAYAELHKPALILLENVEKAPWKEVRNAWRQVGYETVSLKLDSINYYLPQTRSRGYLFGIHKDLAAQASINVEIALQQWVEEMSKFQRRASSPYCDFALSADDPRLLMAKNKSEEGVGKQSSTAWDASRMRHLNTRGTMGLGNDTPYTNRRGNPGPILPDFAWQSWALREPKRVLDFVDIHLLVMASQCDYDTRYKHRNVNVSQNVDRDLDRRQWGIVGAITPHGSLFDTRRGGPVTGLEAFALQGFPIGDLNLGKNRSKQLQNLAGNAMTTTVIAAAILSAVLACHAASATGENGTKASIFEAYANAHVRNTDVDLQPRIEILDYTSLPGPVQITSFPEKTESMIRINQQATDSQPLCRCEGLDRRATCKVVYCQECYYTCCSGCSRESHGGNLRQHLPASQVPRSLAREFITFLNDVLPPVLKLELGAKSEVGHFSKHRQFMPALTQISKALRSRVYFQGIKFQGSWKVTYESEDCRLELDFAQKRYVCGDAQTIPDQHQNSEKRSKGLQLEVAPMWLLFAKAPASASVDSPIREILQRHIGRMKPVGTLFKGVWQFWDGPGQPFKIHIQGKGTQVPAWEQKIGLECEPFRNLMAFSELKILPPVQCNLDTSMGMIEEHESPSPTLLGEICGTYKLLRECPAANGTLHRKDNSSSAPKSPIFLFLKPSPLGAGHLDRVVFSTQASSRDLLDDRAVLASIEAPWRPIASHALKEGMEVCCEPMDEWSPCTLQKLLVPTEENTVRRMYRESKPNSGWGVDCTSRSTLLVVDLNEDSHARRRMQEHRDLCIILEQKPEALKQFGWILPYAAKIPQTEQNWERIDDLIVDTCGVCSPPPPRMRWVTKGSGKGEKVQAIEYTAEAAHYENVLKNRPQPAVAVLCEYGSQVLLDIQINLPTLAHRASTQLSARESKGSQRMYLEWRVVKYYPYAPAPRFRPGKLKSNEDDLVDRLAFETPAKLKRKLWDSQVRVLAWMWKQEMKPRPWEEMALVEACLPALGWSIETRALLNNSEVRGGIIADEVGAGKTTTSLALISLDYYSRTSATAPTIDPKHKGKKIESEASLILVPKNLQKQWEGELKKCLGWNKCTAGKPCKKPYYIVAGTSAALQKYSLKEIKEATIILSHWDLFNENDYWDYLRKIACSPCIPADAGRAFQEWLEEGLLKLDLSINGEIPTGAHATQFWTNWEQSRKDMKQFDRFEGFITRATHKAEFAKPKKGNKPTTKGQQKNSEQKLTSEQCREKARKALQVELDEFHEADEIPILLHMFRFRRLIVDEFTYVPGKTLLGLIQLEASRRWLLSGTPPIHTYDDVNTMAKLLRTVVTTYDEQEGKYGFGRDGSKMSKDKSEAQEFLSYNNLASTGYTEQVYTRACEFLERFARKNPPSLERAEKESDWSQVELSPCERIIYSDVYPLAMDPDRVFGKKTTKETLDSEKFSSIERLAALVEQTSGPEEALLSSNIMLSRVWDGFQLYGEDEPTVDQDAFDQAQLLEAEWARLEAIIGEQESSIISRARQLLTVLQELWGFEANARLSNAKAALSFDQFIQDVKAGKLLDPEAVPVVDRLVWYARDHPLPSMVDVPQQGDYVTRMAAVDGHLEVLMAGVRRLRFLVVVRKVFSGATSGGSCALCNEPSLVKAASQVSSRCGHLACPRCVANGDQCCPLSGDLVGTKFFRSGFLLGPPVSVACSRQRAALDKVSNAVANGDSLLVFAQTKGMKEAFVAACGVAGVVCLDGFEGAAGRAVEKFQSLASEGVVLVLKVDSTDAAGWNLQAASVVVFLAPVLAASAEERSAMMEQAVGRCWRPGQQKKVWVWLVGATGTIESRLAEEWLSGEE